MGKAFLKILNDGRVILNLPDVSCNKRRFIGRISKKDKTFYSVPRYKRIHLFRNTNSLSLPYDLIHKRKKGFIYVCISLDGENKWSSSLAMKKFGKVMQFAMQGFETQIFLNLNKFKKTKREAQYERRELKKGI